MTVYSLIAYHFEERRRLAELGAAYQDYRRRVPALIPPLGRGLGSPLND